MTIDRLPRKIPKHIAEELKRYDNKLRVRWSHEKGKFVIERKVPWLLRWMLPRPIIARHYDNSTRRVVEVLAPGDSDRRIAYNDGYVEVCQASRLDRRLFWFLYQGDTQRRRKNWLRDLELEEKRVEEREEAKQLQRLEDVGADAYDHHQRLAGLRISVGA